jgi:hypothetical protein
VPTVPKPWGRSPAVRLPSSGSTRLRRGRCSAPCRPRCATRRPRPQETPWAPGGALSSTRSPSVLSRRPSTPGGGGRQWGRERPSPPRTDRIDRDHHSQSPTIGCHTTTASQGCPERGLRLPLRQFTGSHRQPCRWGCTTSPSNGRRRRMTPASSTWAHPVPKIGSENVNTAVRSTVFRKPVTASTGAGFLALCGCRPIVIGARTARGDGLAKPLMRRLFAHSERARDLSPRRARLERDRNVTHNRKISLAKCSTGRSEPNQGIRGRALRARRFFGKVQRSDLRWRTYARCFREGADQSRRALPRAFGLHTRQF